MPDLRKIIRENKTLAMFLGAYLLFIAAAWVMYGVFGHSLVKAVYEGRATILLDFLIEGQAAHPLESYLKDADFLFILLNVYSLIIPAYFLYFYFSSYRKKHRLANILFLTVIGAMILGGMAYLRPQRYGDGHEYFLMNQSLFNHSSPDLQDRDISSMEELKTRSGLNYNIFTGYYKATDGKMYCYHFWLYPLAGMPVRSVLHSLGLNEMKLFQITNAILLLAALFYILFVSAMQERQKILFASLAVFCPAFWFIHWTHPEIFSYSFVIISLVYMTRKNWPASVLCASIASTQNQPLVFMVLFLSLRGIISSKNKPRDFLLLAAAAMPAVLPSLFYYSKYGVTNLILEKAATVKNLSAFKAMEMFFDLNIGMLPYIPLTLLVFFGILLRDIFVKRRFSLSAQFFVLMFVMMLSCTLTQYWNMGTSGPTRYVIWMLPLIFYILVNEKALLPGANRPAYLSVVWAAVIVQAAIVFIGGGFLCYISYIHHTPPARFVLNHFPAAYNPSEDIFIRRTLHRHDTSGAPVVYYYKGKCRKVLARGRDEKEVTRLCGYIPKDRVKFFSDGNNRDRLTYLNY